MTVSLITLILLLFLTSKSVDAVVNCGGTCSNYLCDSQCEENYYGTYSCKITQGENVLSCGWSASGTVCMGYGEFKFNCDCDITNYGYSCTEVSQGTWGEGCSIGCWTCDTEVCKAGTTTYLQACGSETRDYSCTNQCNTSNKWTTYDNACKECQTATNCGLNPRDCSADYCQHCEPTLGAWSSCGSDHKQSRSCTDKDGDCDDNDCAAETLVRDCVGTITGTLFDASDLALCPADIGTNAAYSSIRFANEVFGINPVTAGKWPVISAPVASDANGNYSERVYASATVPALYDFDFSTILASDRVAGVKFQCQTNQAAVTSQDQVVRKDIGFWRVYGGWWQVVGGSVYAAEGIESTIPASLLPMTDQVLILPNANGRDGLLSHGTAWQGTELGTNPNVQVSNSLRRIRSLYGGLRYDYNFYKTRMDIFTKTAWDGGAVTYSDGGKGYQIFTHTGNVTLNALSLTGSQKAIFLVDGDVTISGNILSPVGTFMGIISSGKITVRPWVTDVQGWVVAETIDIPCEDANSNGVCDKTDVQFKGEGSFVAWTDMNFDRDQYKVNNTQPSEKFVYRNDFLLNVPAPMKVYTRKFTPFVP